MLGYSVDVPKLIFAVAPRLGLPVNRDALTSVTRGLVGNTSFAVLPEVKKEHTFLLTFIFQLVCTFTIPLQPLLTDIASSNKTLAPSRVDNLCGRHYSLRIRLVPFRMARPRKGSPPDYHSIQLDRSQGPSVFRCLPTSCGGRSCVTIPVALYRRRIPHQVCLHSAMAGFIPLRVRPGRPSTREAADICVRPLLPALPHDCHPTDSVLLARPPADLRMGTVRIPAADVYKQLFSSRGGRQLGGIHGGLFYRVDVRQGGMELYIRYAYDVISINRRLIPFPRVWIAVDPLGCRH